MEEKTKVLILGGTGIIGQHLSSAATSAGYSVYTVSRGLKKVDDSVQVITVDARDKGALSESLSGMYFDTVIDLLSFNNSQLKSMMDVLRGKCSQYIFVSSATVYDSREGRVITEEAAHLKKGWVYPIDKSNTEQFFLDECKENGMLATIVRPYITYSDQRISFGEWEGSDFLEILEHGKPVILGDELANAKTTLTHSRDLANGIVGLIANKKAYGEAFHITSDESYTWRHVVEVTADILQKEVAFTDTPISNVESHFPDLAGKISDRCMSRVFDNSKIKGAAANLQATHSLRDGYAEVLRNYKQGSISYIFQGRYDRMVMGLDKQTHSGSIKAYERHVLKTSLKSYLKYKIGRHVLLYTLAINTKNIVKGILGRGDGEYSTGAVRK